MSKLSPGTMAPEFVLPSLSGEVFSTANVRGSMVLYSFLRNAQCALCNLWVHQAMSHFETWKRQGLTVVAVFESTPEKLRVQFAEHTPPFPVLADEDGAVHELYGSINDPETVQEIIASGEGEVALKRAVDAGFVPVREEGSNFVRLPSEVVVDAKGRVVLFHLSDRVSNHLDAKAIDQLLVRSSETQTATV